MRALSAQNQEQQSHQHQTLGYSHNEEQKIRKEKRPDGLEALGHIKNNSGDGYFFEGEETMTSDMVTSQIFHRSRTLWKLSN